MTREMLLRTVSRALNCQGSSGLCTACKRDLREAYFSIRSDGVQDDLTRLHEAELKKVLPELKFLRKELAHKRALLRRFCFAARPEGYGINDDWLLAEVRRHNHLASLRERRHRKAVRK